MSAPLEPKLAELLIRLTKLDADRYETFQPHFSGDSLGEAELMGFDGERVPEGPIKELADRGLLSMDVPPGKKLGEFRITERGRELAAELERANAESVDFSWSVVEPVVRQIHRAWLDAGAPLVGLSGPAVHEQLDIPLDQKRFAAVLHELQRQDWIEYRLSLGPQLPQGLKPSGKAVAYIDGWPTSDARVFAQQLIARLEERVDAEPDEAERSKLRASLAEVGTFVREVAVEVAGKTLAQQAGA